MLSLGDVLKTLTGSKILTLTEASSEQEQRAKRSFCGPSRFGPVRKRMPLTNLLLLLVVVFTKWTEPFVTPNPDVDTYEPSDFQRASEYYRDGSGTECKRCCEPAEDPPQYPEFRVVPHINITILKGEKGDHGQRGHYGKSGRTGQTGPRGPNGIKGAKGNIGVPGEPCKSYYAAFSVGRKKALHSNDYYQAMIFDTEFVNLYSHFNMFSGKFFCYVPGIYFFSLNAHTWNQKETYLHIMKNEQEMAILYAQPSDRSIMQTQSLMLELERDDQVWVRLFKGERENAVFSDDYDTYITFNGHLIKAKSEG